MNTEKKWNQWRDEILSSISGGYAVMMFTDRFEVDIWPLAEQNEERLEKEMSQKLLDMRVFCESAEYRIFRSFVGAEFVAAYSRDEGQEYYDDEQYLDIDEKESAKTFGQAQMVRAMGGGYYRLPLESYRRMKVRIRNYVAYDEASGQAYIKGWRLVGFFQEKEG